MSEPYWELLGGGGVQGGPIDYIGTWNVAVPYVAGQVVTYNGHDYLAVNPSTGSTPPAPASPVVLGATYGTTLPTAPFEGQEHILVDSVTNPTYQWRFRWNPGSSSAYKWEFVGGAPFYTYPSSGSQTIAAVSSWTWPAVPVDFVVPRAGEYLFTVGTIMSLPSGSGTVYVGIANASVTPTPPGPYFGQTPPAAGQQASMSVLAKLAMAAGQTARVVHYSPVASTTVLFTYLSVQPLRIS